MHDMQGLEKAGALTAISESARKCKYTTEEVGCPEVRHFLYKSKTTAQFTGSEFAAPYANDPIAQNRLHNLYLFAQSKTHASGRNAKFIYLTGKYENLASWVSISVNKGCLTNTLFVVAPTCLKIGRIHGTAGNMHA